MTMIGCGAFGVRVGIGGFGHIVLEIQGFFRVGNGLTAKA